MSTTATGLSDAALDALRAATATDVTIRLHTPGLPRDVYAEVNRVFERIGGGGKWNRHAGAHTFPMDPRPELADVIASGEMPVDADKAASFWRTPDALADLMVARLELAGGKAADVDVCEPSAGDGAIVRAIRRAYPVVYLDAIEPEHRRASQLQRLAAADDRFDVYETTLEQWSNALPGPRWDAVVMNPPFTLPGNSTVWVDHVELAWSKVRPGGRLVAVVPSSLAFRGTRKIMELRARVERYGRWEHITGAAFRGSGTDVATILLDVPGLPR